MPVRTGCCSGADGGVRAGLIPKSEILFHGELRRGGLLLRRSSEQSFLFLRASNGGDVDRGGSGSPESLGAGAGGSPGGVNVVDEQHVAIGNGRGAGRDKCSAEILAPLMGGKTGLAFGGALPYENVGGEMEAPIGATAAEDMDGAAREDLRLIEAALAALAGKEGNGHDDQVSGQIGDGENGICEKRAETPGQRVHAVVFQQVHQGAQFVAVEAPGDGLLKRRRRSAAGTAEGLFAEELRFIRQRFAAAVAERAGLRGKMVPAGRADGEQREAGERKAADTAIGGKEYGGETVEGTARRTSQHADHRAPGRIGGWRNFRRQWKTLTTEDAPRSGGRNAES